VLLLLSVVIYLMRAVKKEKVWNLKTLKSFFQIFFRDSRCALTKFVLFQRKVQQLTAHEIKMFLDGATENIDHELALDQQADFLPYNPNYEYSRENLKLGTNASNVIIHLA
jgi:hypothetical protein